MTGTPGTGKTTIAALLPYRVIDINALVKGGMNFGKDPDRGCLEADMDALADHLVEQDCDEVLILEGHFSHHFANWAIVLRLAPSVLKSRLVARGYSSSKIQENLEAEALDVILFEAAERCDRVDEIDTTEKSPKEVTELVTEIVQGKLQLPAGQVDWLTGFFG